MDTIPQKCCSKCGNFKPETLEHFKFLKRYNHFDNICRECVNLRDMERRRRNGILPKNKPLSDGTKGCAKCKRILPLHMFYLQANGKYAVYCSDCKASYSKEFYHRDIESSRIRSNTQRIKHRQKDILRRKEKYSERRKSTADWVSRNRDKVNASIRKRRALKLGLPYELSPGLEFEIISRFDGRCAVCGRAEGKGRMIVLDHWIAIKSGISNNPGTVESNLVPICHGIEGCNNSKRNRLPLEWLLAKFGEQGHVIYNRIERYLAEVRSGNCTNNI